MRIISLFLAIAINDLGFSVDSKWRSHLGAKIRIQTSRSTFKTKEDRRLEQTSSWRGVDVMC